MHNKKLEIACIIGIFLFAFSLRLYAFTYLPKRAITDDAHEYNYIAQNIFKALNDETLENREAFLYRGEKRGWLYPFFIALIYKIFGPHAHYVLLAQALIDSLTCILIYAIGKEIFNRKVGAVAAFFSAFYPAFVYYSTILYQETTTIFLLTLFVFLLCRAISRKKPLLYFIPGMLVIIVSFYRSGFILFPVFIIPSLFFILWFFYKKDSFPPFLYFCTGVLCMVIIYGMFSYRISGSFIINRPSIAWSIYETTHREGWPSDTFAPTLTEELKAVAHEYNYTIVPDGHQLGLPPKVYLMATMRHALNNPLGYFSQIITRCKRMWAYVETYPERWHSQSVLVQLIIHRALIILALVGIPLSVTVLHHSWLFLSIIVYVTSAFIPTIGLPRYAVPAMPFVIIMAAYALLSFGDMLKCYRKRLISSRYFPLLLATITFAGLQYYLTVSALLSLFPQWPPGLCHATTIILANLFFIIIACWGYQLFSFRFKNRRLSLYAISFPLIIVILLYNNTALTSKNWHEWSCHLLSPHQKIKHTILVPDDLNRDEYISATLMIDMFGGGGDAYTFGVEVNGELIKKFQNGITARKGKFEKKFFGLYKSFFFDTYGLTPEDLRQWYEIKLPWHFLKNNSQLVIECSLGGTVDDNRNSVIVFGDYHTTNTSNLFEGPCFPRSDEDTSIFKILPYSGDNRFEKITLLNSKKTMSEYYNGLEWQANDLSSVRGIQSGSYRIRVELVRKDGRQVIL